MDVCCVCGRSLPNRWAVAKREVVEGEERCYCALHAGGGAKERSASGKSRAAEEAANDNKERNEMNENHARETENPDRERDLARRAGTGAAKKAWAACAGLAGKAAGGLKSLWAKIHPDRSPEAMVESLNGTLSANRKRLAELKPELEKAYAEIVARKAAWQKAPEARKRLLKTELETLLARYKGLEREFGVLNENTRTAEAVKGRYLEVLAYELRGQLGEDEVDDLSGLVDEKAEEAEGVQDALRDLEKAGRRKERGSDDLEAELAGFDGELGLDETAEPAESDPLKDDGPGLESPDAGSGLEGFEEGESER